MKLIHFKDERELFGSLSEGLLLILSETEIVKTHLIVFKRKHSSSLKWWVGTWGLHGDVFENMGVSHGR